MDKEIELEKKIIKKSNIYTKTGDKGTTSLYTGERRLKTDPIFDALGDLDELNASLGVVLQYCQYNNKIDNEIKENIIIILEDIQSRLIDIGSNIATPIKNQNISEKKKEKIKFDEENIKILEQWIDQFDSSLPILKNFILPSGGFTSSHLHISRAICRRVERKVWLLINSSTIEDKTIAIYLNRLSDFLFVIARYITVKEGNKETIYQKEKGKMLLI
jgi:cob(I)alamin adenosyltransferase